jgi:hypothetical protein
MQEKVPDRLDEEPLAEWQVVVGTDDSLENGSAISNFCTALENVAKILGVRAKTYIVGSDKAQEHNSGPTSASASLAYKTRDSYNDGNDVPIMFINMPSSIYKDEEGRANVVPGLLPWRHLFMTKEEEDRIECSSISRLVSLFATPQQGRVVWIDFHINFHEADKTPPDTIELLRNRWQRVTGLLTHEAK